MKHEEKKPEHWFREHAETTPIQYLRCPGGGIIGIEIQDLRDELIRRGESPLGYHEEKEPKEHWFREHAETTPIQYLPLTTVSAVRAVVHGKSEDKLGSIKQIIEIYDDLLKEGKASGTSGTRD